MTNRAYNIDTVGDDVSDFLDAVLDAADFDVEYELVDGEEAAAYFEKPTLVVRFFGDDLEFLLANKGEALLALEQLTQEVLDMDNDEHALICFDANDFRLLRQEELRVSALTIAAQVRESKQPYRFNPMNSRERRIVHLALRNETDLRTESSGAGPSRHVVVYPAGMPSLPEPPPGYGLHRPSGPGGRDSRGGGRDSRGGGRDSRGGGRGGDRRGGGGGRRGGPPRRGR
jgi:spoIIIJ-associated protein